MKSPLEEAELLFKENEMLFGDVKQDKEKANLYRGLAQLAEGMSQLEKRMKNLEMEELGVTAGETD